MGHLIKIAAIYLLLMTSVVQAARYPNAVEESFALYGKAAEEVASLFDLTGSKSKTTLKLGQNTAWAIYLLKQDAPTRLYNSDGQPDRFNVIQFAAGPRPMLSIGPFWENLGTSLPEPKPGYRIVSDDISTNLEGDDPWVLLLQKLKTSSEWKGECYKGGSSELYAHSHIDEEGSKLSLRVWCYESFPKNIPTLMYKAEITFEKLG